MQHEFWFFCPINLVLSQFIFNFDTLSFIPFKGIFVHAAQNLKSIDMKITVSFLFAFLLFYFNPTTSFGYSSVETSIKVGTTTRTMISYAPPGLAAKRPLIISMHGSNQDPAFQQNQSKWEEVADTARFAVVYPRGNGLQWDLGGNSDVDFVLAIIDTMVNRYQIDRNRVYLNGFSMGGMFTYYAMNKMADKIAAFAPVSGYLMGGPNTNSIRPVPIIHTHGTTDDVVNFGGVQGCLNAWVTRNGCVSTPVVTAPYPTTLANSACTKRYWAAGSGGVEVVLMEIKNKGHWYSLDVAGAINTSIEVWNFCKKYALDLSQPTIAITSPSAGSSYTTFGGDASVDKIVLSANASDPDGTVDSVSFYDGTTLLFTDRTAPYTYNWINVPAGTHVIKAVVTDNDQKTTETTTTIYVNAPSTSFNISSGVNASGALPAGWITWDGSAKRIGPMNSLTSGSRTFQFTGTPRDFDYGIYFRNIPGTANAGSISYAGLGSSATLKLAPGIYTLSYQCVNWNLPAFGEISAQIQCRDNDSVIALRTVKPTTNLTNVANLSFSGATQSTLWFEITESRNYTIQFCSADFPMSDGVIANAVLSKPTGDPLASSKVLIAKALGDARLVAKAASAAIYAGSDFNNLTAVLSQYNDWSSNTPSEFVTASQVVKSAADALLQHKLDIDATKQTVTIFSDNFSTSGEGVLPKGWKTFDSATQRVGTGSAYGNGSRILRFTGTTRDFEYGLYLRNIGGGAKLGYAKFGALYSDSLLTLTPGNYKLLYKVCNWNMSGFGAITGGIANRTDSVMLFSQTVTPTTNIGNSVGNSFSGSTPVEINFTITTTGHYAIEFYTANAGWADAIVSEISLTKTVYTAIPAVTTNPTRIGVRYYTLNGLEIPRMAKGLNIKRELFSDGTIKVTKIFQQ